MTKAKKPHEDGDDILAIDKYSLDEAWVNQAQLYNWYVVKTADARQVMDEAKSRLEVIKAELVLSVMSNPDAFGLTKTTVVLVEATVIMQPQYTDAVAEVHTTKHDYDCLQGLLIALDHKKKALEKLVELQGRDYFSDPKPPEEDWERLGEVSRDAVARKGTKKRRLRVSED